MNPWPEIHRQRLAVADLLDDLKPADWDHPSLCDGWTVRDVAAHLTLQQLRLRDVFGLVRHWKGGMHPTIQAAARRQAAALTPAQIVADIRDTAAARRYNFGVTPVETLIDLLVHSQDIAIPLGRTHPMPPEAAAVATRRVLTMRIPPPPPSVRVVAGLHLTATDIGWSYGDGPEVRGPIAALLLVSTGRTVALPQLTGPGAALLAARSQTA
ncbi:maleylpyruvate isomerase family mycothiol-dependent enzyme [Actinoplanes aureus]|uniref:Maleylpyruvate isomerase family mycothiol-dependent enzyme n=1 Tax=Actinoplanes aureus TaxID=2792083 RepID=A0A931CA74_9ACTN|nr:maleylpyruvate isomerase family mycothiol-dependent enzyme [Actinoplanes aureus]MBG0561160.1 maleylpyruvate isomerase family mycothiol-dependent enzyme [Actinoplanes aureus]